MSYSLSSNMLECPQLPDGFGIRRAYLFAAVDRPDRLELEIVPASSEPLDAVGGLQALRPGCAAEMCWESHAIFAGQVERCGMRFDRGGWCFSVVAYAGYDSLRSLKPRATYFELTDAEIASRIAGELGLRSRIERTFEVHRRLERQGDPLRFLRNRARASGFDLAVTGGTLYFAKEIPCLDRAPLGVDIHSGLGELDFQDRGAGGRAGVFEVPGDLRFVPLAPLEVTGFGPAWDDRYHVARVLHGLDASSFRTRVEFFEPGTDIASWQGEEASGA